MTVATCFVAESWLKPEVRGCNLATIMLYISRLKLTNWRNFRSVDLPMRPRMFLVGANASGKSNLLEAVRFLRDLCRTGGGLQFAVQTARGGLTKIRSLFAHGPSEVTVGCEISDDAQAQPLWRYELSVNQTGGGVHKLAAVVKSEAVWAADTRLFKRPEPEDATDERLLEYTRLEQPLANKNFREMTDFLALTRYLHVVPQLVKAGASLAAAEDEDYFGSGFIDRIARLNANTRRSHLSRIKKALQIAVPHFDGLELVQDDRGRYHLETVFRHWRPKGARQREDQFSDGTLRLIGFLWSLLDGKGVLLLEEPELSLHTAVVTHLAEIIARLQRRDSGARQVIATTHSLDLLRNPGIAAEEIAALIPTENGTEVKTAADITEVKALLDAGIPAGEAVLPSTTPPEAEQLLLDLL